MARVIVATVATEGGLYSPDRDPSAPIRVYSDRWVEDNIAYCFTGNVKRNRLSRNEARRIRLSAARNRRAGCV